MTHARSDYFMVAVTAWQPNMAPQLRISALEEGIWPAGRMNVPVCSTGTCDMHAYSLLNFTGTSTGRDEPPLPSALSHLDIAGPVPLQVHIWGPIPARSYSYVVGTQYFRFGVSS